MKKVIATILFFVSLSASAESWVHVGYTGDNNNYYVDNHSLTYGPQNIVSGWVYVAKSNGTYEYARYEAYCPTKMIKIPTVVTYFSNGTVMNSFSIDYWQYAVPRSITMLVVNYMCGKK